MVEKKGVSVGGADAEQRFEPPLYPQKIQDVNGDVWKDMERKTGVSEINGAAGRGSFLAGDLARRPL